MHAWKFSIIYILLVLEIYDFSGVMSLVETQQA